MKNNLFQLISLISKISLMFIFYFCFVSCDSKKSTIHHKHNYTLEKIVDLPIQLKESSGIIYFDSLLWTFNDGGNESKLYGFGLLSGEIEKVISIKDIKQIDWEDIAQDSAYIYVGDIGNNFGTRNNLSIIRINKADIDKTPEQELLSQVIYYSYPDQLDFNANRKNTSFDCEALTCMDDSLLLFTKDWVNHTSSVYNLSKNPGIYKASKIETINIEGLITAADYDPKSRKLILIGHSEPNPFMITFNHVHLSNLIGKKFSKFVFDACPGVKIEGVTSIGDQIYFSSEGEYYRQAIYKLTKK